MGQLDDRRILTAVRDERESWATDGFVIALTDSWVVMHVLESGVYLDNLAFLRLRDITRVWFRDDDAYHHRAIDDLGLPIATIDCPRGVARWRFTPRCATTAPCSSAG